MGSERRCRGVGGEYLCRDSRPRGEEVGVVVEIVAGE